MSKIECPLSENEPAPCEACPLQSFKSREYFSLEERELRRAYVRGFDSVDAEDPLPDPQNPAYLYDFVNAAEISLISPLDPYEASAPGTSDNEFTLALLDCLYHRYILV